jgi:hypothetical protein
VFAVVLARRLCEVCDGARLEAFTLFNSRYLAAAVTAALVTCAHPAHAALIGYYTFEGNANDVSGNGNHGILSATAPTLTAAGGGYTGWDGAASQAYAFGGGNTFITVPIDINPAALPQVTFGAWVKAENLDNVIRGIISHDNGNFDRTLDMDTRGQSANVEWCLFVGPASGGVYCAEDATSDWTFLVARYDALTNVAQLTVNGMHSSLLATSNGGGLTTTTIGRNPNFDFPFIGLIDNAFFFNSYLTDAQLDEIRRNGITVVPEPSALLMLSAGAIALLRRRRGPQKPS